MAGVRRECQSILHATRSGEDHEWGMYDGRTPEGWSEEGLPVSWEVQIQNREMNSWHWGPNLFFNWMVWRIKCPVAVSACMRHLSLNKLKHIKGTVQNKQFENFSPRFSGSMLAARFARMRGNPGCPQDKQNPQWHQHDKLTGKNQNNKKKTRNNNIQPVRNIQTTLCLKGGCFLGKSD